MTDHVAAPAPEGPAPGSSLFRFWKADLLAGFLVFLIALPLCLAISIASGYPAIAGVYTAIIGGILCSFISNSELTIKGPAAGLIMIAIGAVTGLGEEAVPQLPPEKVAELKAEGKTNEQVNAVLKAEQMKAGYPRALGIAVVAAFLQILLGLFRAGRLGDFFPLSAVHGMLAAIGITIIAKQIPFALGHTSNAGRAIPLLGQVPEFIQNAYWPVATVGLISLVILFGLPWVRNKYVRRIPAPMLVLLVAIPLAYFIGQQHASDTYMVKGSETHFAGAFLIQLPSIISGLTMPNFSGVATATGIQFIIMFALIGSLESLLSAKAIDLLDPWKRKSNLDRDLLAIGVANMCCAWVGGLPMISEIVRSRANIDNGARTRLADMFHSLFLLVCVALLSRVLMMIPLAALAAMLIFTGFRLASPKEFVHTFRIGLDQLLIFVTTVVVTLVTDLLVGIAAGIVLKFVLHLIRGVPPGALFRSDVAVEATDGETVLVRVRRAAVFSNWLALKSHINRLGPDVNVVVDLSDANFVDHTVLEKLHEMEADFKQRGKHLEVRGLEGHRATSSHPFSTRKKPSQPPVSPPANVS